MLCQLPGDRAVVSMTAIPSKSRAELNQQIASDLERGNLVLGCKTNTSLKLYEGLAELSPRTHKQAQIPHGTKEIAADLHHPNNLPGSQTAQMEIDEASLHFTSASLLLTVSSDVITVRSSTAAEAAMLKFIVSNLETCQDAGSS